MDTKEVKRNYEEIIMWVCENGHLGKDVTTVWRNRNFYHACMTCNSERLAIVPKYEKINPLTYESVSGFYEKSKAKIEHKGYVIETEFCSGIHEGYFSWVSWKGEIIWGHEDGWESREESEADIKKWIEEEGPQSW